jgi:hypothetical protein
VDSTSQKQKRLKSSKCKTFVEQQSRQQHLEPTSNSEPPQLEQQYMEPMSSSKPSQLEQQHLKPLLNNKLEQKPKTIKQ